MRDYQLYAMPGGMYKAYQEFQARSDDDAVAIAAPFTGSVRCELWRNNTRVRIFDLKSS
jgi:hypothetical protein